MKSDGGLRSEAALALESTEADEADECLVESILTGKKELYALLMRRHNQRLYRLVRSIVRSEHEAEDVVQHAYVTAFHKLPSFRQEARFRTWITRIAINEALARVRKSSRHPHVTLMESDARTADAVTTPEDASYRHEMGQLLERHIDSLPESLRVVFVMREVEELTTAETATLLAISQEAVRVRLHRARSLLQEQIASVLTWAPEAFHFGGERCNRMVRSVFRELGIEEPGSGAPAQEASGRSLR